MDKNDPDFIIKLLKLMAQYDSCDSLWWRVDYGVLRFFVNCNDVFCWACADAEPVTPENIDLLRQSFEDEQTATGGSTSVWGPMLFCARSRGERIQGAWYKDGSLPKELWPLFDAVGERRPVDLGNPYSHPSENEDGTAKYAYKE